MTNHQRFEKILKDNRQSITSTRAHVFTALQTAHEPLTMQQLIAKVKGKADRVSVYRTTALFEQLRIVQRIHLGWKYKLELSDTFLEHHHHLSCLSCGKTIDTYGNPEIEQHITALSAAHGFTLTGHQLEMQGYCEACRRSK